MKKLIILILIGFSINVSGENKSDRSKYPVQWWMPMSETDKASWEILPQEAKEGEVILTKKNELGLLSNFAPTPFVLDGKRYASIEGFWQMMYYPEGKNDERAKLNGWQYSRDQVAQMSAFPAKTAGKLAKELCDKNKIDWVTYKGEKIYPLKDKDKHYKLIKSAMLAKAKQNPYVKELLLKTGDLILRADHKQSENDPPAWHYEKIWMEIRSELKK